MPVDDDPQTAGRTTLPTGSGLKPIGAFSVRRYRLTVVGGLPAGGGAFESGSDRTSLGSDPGNQLRLEDPTVSRFHCEVGIDSDGARVRDLGSRNGTLVDGVRVKEAYLKEGSTLTLGGVTLRFDFRSESVRLPFSDRTEFGSLVGRSAAMRITFGLLERAAAVDSTVLLEGETGTGKGAAAEALHLASNRKDKPFLVVDCSAIPAALLESELFGHEKGSFTGAHARRIGVFEEAQGGTVFLDEIGEMPLDLQPKLLRVLENRQVRRIGSNAALPVDVKLVAATNRDLRAEVNAGRFRPDLYFRIAVLRIPTPPLRQRPEDVPPIAERALRSLGATPEQVRTILTPALVGSLQQGAWPGNVRELRNYLERCFVFGEGVAQELPLHEGPAHDPSLSYEEARRRALAEFERRYLAALLDAHHGNVTRAAAAAGMDRVYLHRLLRRHGIR